MSVVELAKALFHAELPSRNKAFDRYRDDEFAEAVRLVKSTRHLLDELSQVDHVSATWRGEHLELSYRLRDVERTVVLDADRLALVEGDERFLRATKTPK